MDNIEEQIAEVDGVAPDEIKSQKYEPVYRVYDDTKIPVSKSMGQLWKGRRDEGRQEQENSGAKDRWNEAIAYYQNDQSGRTWKRSKLGQVATGKDSEQSKLYTTENVVFATVSALVPATYMKNPDTEITATKTENEKQAKLFERLLDHVFSSKMAPGINLKPKIKRGVVITTLTNIAYFDLSYIFKEDSSEAAMQDIMELSEQLQKAKDVKEIEEIEGKLMALDHKIAILTEEGPRCRVRMPDMVIADPDRECADFSDAAYVMTAEYLRVEYVQAMYGKKKPDSDEWESIYQPSHVLPAGKKNMQGHDDEINNFTLLQGKPEYSEHGYDNQDEFNKACRVLVWYVWDKTTRRVLMFNDKDWTWPIWVWDDPYKLTNFYPIIPMTFNTDPKDVTGRGEVVYYLDQQDEINRINNEKSRMRHWAMSKIFVDDEVFKDPKALQKFLSRDTDDLVHTMKIPEGKKIADVMSGFPAPSTQFESLFDTAPIYESINRLSSATAVLRNVEYKTNTTNKAIESYESGTQQRLDEKIDAIEECVGEIGITVLEMLVVNLSAETVERILGKEFVDAHGGWRNMSVEEFRHEFSLKLIGGSTLKPTSRVKKEQAMQMGQVLGQFAQGSPMVVVILMKAIERAFGDDITITAEEWQALLQSIEQLVQAQTQQTAQKGAPSEGGEQPQQGGEGDLMEQAMGMLEQVINELPPEARQAIGEGLASGEPIKQLVQGAIELVQSPEGTQQ